MKKMLTLTTLAVLSTSFASVAMANWDFFNRSEVHASAVYSKPSNNGLDVGSTAIPGFAFGPSDPFVFGGEAPSYGQNQIGIEPGFAWNWGVGFSYLFCNSKTRFFMDYEYFQDHEHLSGGDVSNGQYINKANLFSRVEMKQNMFRFGITETFNYCPTIAADVSVYFEYDRLIQNLNRALLGADVIKNVEFGNSNLNVSLDNFLHSHNKFHGFGPGVGLKLQGAPFAQCPGITLFGGVMTTLLFGNAYGVYANDYNFLFTGFDDEEEEFFSTPVNRPIALNPASNATMIAKFDVDVGIDYEQRLDVDCNPMILGITIGVRYMNMINALKYSNHIGTVSRQGPGDFLEGSDFSLSENFSNYDPVDWGRVGPYIQFRLGGAAS